MDLAGEPDAAGDGWTLIKGVLVVQAAHNDEELMAFLEAKLIHHSWFEPRSVRDQTIAAGEHIPTPQLPAGFSQYLELFKSLGRWGKNPAMDVVTLLIEPDGSISVQVIIRQFDKKYAFVGGMIDKDLEAQSNGILKTCVAEFLEEYYSGNLFKLKSASYKAADTPDNRARVPELLASLLAEDKKNFASIQTYIPQLLGAMGQSDLEANLVAFESALKALAGHDSSIDASKQLRSEDLDHMWVLVKCELYRVMFSDKYQLMVDFLKAHLVQLPETTNESDPRNTQSAFMTTVPYYFKLDKVLLARLEAEWLVEPKGGDDAISAKIVPLQKLFEQSMYAAHGRILLGVIADVVAKDPALLDNPSFQKQMQEIESHILHRESVGVSAAPHASLFGRSDGESSSVAGTCAVPPGIPLI